MEVLERGEREEGQGGMSPRSLPTTHFLISVNPPFYVYGVGVLGMELSLARSLRHPRSLSLVSRLHASAHVLLGLTRNR